LFGDIPTGKIVLCGFESEAKFEVKSIQVIFEGKATTMES